MPVYDDQKVKKYNPRHDDPNVTPDQRRDEIEHWNERMKAPAKEPDLDVKKLEENANDGSSVSKEQQTEIDQIGAGYSQESERFQRSKGALRRFTGNRKMALWGGGLIGGGLIGTLLLIASLLPLKINHIMSNLERTFYATALQATSDMSDNLFRHYIVKQVVPGMVANNCTSTRVNKDCVNTSTSNNIVGVLYNGWRDGKLETRLGDQGIEIKKVGNSFYLKTPSTSGNGELLGDFDANDPDSFRNSAFQKLNRSDLRRELRTALKQDTKWDRAMFRFKVGSMLERKYGVKRCVIACETRDKWSDNIDTRKTAFKAYFLERVIEPRNEMLSLIFSCGLDSFKCADVGDADANGEQLSQFETDLRDRLAQYRDKYGQTSLDDLKAEADKVSQKGAFEYMLSRLVGEATAKTVGKAIPVVGWIDLGATLVEAGDNLAPALVKLTYITNATTAVAVYSMYRTNADEIKTGNVDTAMVGSVADSLSQTNGTERKDQGGMGAEGSPLYGALMGSTNSNVTLNPFSTRAYAAGTGYTCEDNDNKAPPNSEPVCRVERFDNKTTTGTVADFIDAQFKNNPQLAGGVILAKVWDYTGGAVLDFAESLLAPVIEGFIAAIPGDPIAQMEKLVKPIIENFMRFIVKPTITDSTSGARMFNLAAAGADESGNNFAHYELGAAKISDEEAYSIRATREAEYKSDFDNRSMFARMFSTDTQYSLVSKMALAMPGSGLSGTSQSLLGTITNPFNNAFSSIGSMFSGGSASAALNKDPFGITQMGYPSNDPVFTQDPEKYFEENNCGDEQTIKDWGERAITNPETGTQDHKEGDTEGCKLIDAAAGSVGALYGVLPEETEPLPTDPTESVDTFTVASYNILQGIHHYPTKCDTGESALECIRRRSEAQTKIITAEETTAELAGQRIHEPFDIIGMQEVSPLQYTNLKNNLAPKGYAAFPLNGDRIDNQEDGGHAIFWNTAKFTMVDSGKAPGLSNVASTPNRGNITVPWVGLETLSKKKIYVMSVHWPVAGYTDPDLGDVATLRKGVGLARDWVKSVAGPDATVIIVGDFNDAPEQRTTYCGLTQGGLLQNAFDLRDNKDKNTACPSIGVLRGIDHIYSTPTEGLKVTKWTRMQEVGIVARASDHPPTYATYAFPGDSVGGTVEGDDYKQECGSYAPDVKCNGECVDFVKFRLKKHIDRNKFASIGNGKDVAATLGRDYGYAVNNRPAVNSVVSWPAGGVPGSGANDTYGHVAMVSKVNADGSIVVEEYNVEVSYGYGTRVIPASIVPQLTYAHTEADYR